MDIAYRSRCGAYAHTGTAPVNASGIRTAGNTGLGLPRDAAPDAGVAQQLEQRRVVNGRAVHERQHNAAAHAADRVCALDLGEVGRCRALKHHGKAGVERECHARRAAQTDFLLHGEAEPGVDGRLVLKELEQCRAAHAVVNGLGLNESVTELGGRGVEHAVVAERHQLFGRRLGGRADVDIEVLGFRHGAALGGSREMHRLDADNALSFAEADRTADDHARVYAADKAEFQVAVVGDFLDDDADLIHVCAEHDRTLERLCALSEHHDVADGVCADFVRKGFCLFEHELAHGVLAAGRTRQGAQLLHQFNHALTSPSNSRRNAAMRSATASTSESEMTSTGVCIYF